MEWLWGAVYALALCHVTLGSKHAIIPLENSLDESQQQMKALQNVEKYIRQYDEYIKENEDGGPKAYPSRHLADLLAPPLARKRFSENAFLSNRGRGLSDPRGGNVFLDQDAALYASPQDEAQSDVDELATLVKYFQRLQNRPKSDTKRGPPTGFTRYVESVTRKPDMTSCRCFIDGNDSRESLIYRTTNDYKAVNNMT